MALRLMYITKSPDVAAIAEKNGVDMIFVDMEYIGKSSRQGGMDTVQSHHTVDDVKNVRKAVNKSELLVRINPIHPAQAGFCSSKDEINAVIDNGADVIMLPYFKSINEVEYFLSCVNKRAKTILLVETPQAVDLLYEILTFDEIDRIHIGINDLSIAYGMKFMFQLLADGTVENICKKIAKTDIPYGFGGIASIGKGIVPSEMIIREHYRIGSTSAILSRSFCNINTISELSEIDSIFRNGVKEIREFETECINASESSLLKNQRELIAKVQDVLSGNNV